MRQENVPMALTCDKIFEEQRFMGSNISQEDFNFLKSAVENAEPYSKAEFEQMAYFDGESHIGDQRYAATKALRALLYLGFAEDEVNPWKTKR